MKVAVKLYMEAVANLFRIRDDGPPLHMRSTIVDPYANAAFFELDAACKNLQALMNMPDPIPAPAAQVPQAWRDVMAELAADLQAACEAEHPHREQYPSIMRKYQSDMAIVERARAMLQEVKS